MKKEILQVLAIVLAYSSAVNAQAPDPVLSGKNLFRAKCVACHSVACNRQGPKLEGLFGRRAASVSDFKDYTAELRASEIVWTEKTVDAFLRDPDKLVPGTLMSVIGRIDSAKDRKDLIAYMRREDRGFDLCR
jgi:cytochrome c